LLARHRDATIIWAHTGVGRVVRPVKQHTLQLEEILKDPAYSHVHFDISWDEVAKYVTSSPEALEVTAAMINRYPTRFLFGTDEVAPPDEDSYLRVYRQYAPLWAKLTPEASEQVRISNYIRLFDAARVKVRAWEAKNGLQAPK
jgi:hypothetical protein